MNLPVNQSGKSSVIPELLKFLQKIPLGEQEILLYELEERFSRLQRKHKRKDTRSEVECTTTYQSNKGHITNISTGGVFIESRMPFRCGDDMRLRFAFPQSLDKQLFIHGQIVRITPTGIGVQFKGLSKEYETYLESHCDS
jgi:hypothetical protein